MSVRIEARYLGDLRCEARHGPSGSVLLTDAPLDNQGRGESFSPTDLVATALATCVLTIAGIRAKALGADLRGARAEIEKVMSDRPPRRIARLALTVTWPEGLAPDVRRALEEAVEGCPVARSLHPDLEVETSFLP